MPDPLQTLGNRVSLLGNHHTKYLRDIDAHLDLLVEKLEAAGNIDRVHLWTSSQNIPEEMDVIVALGESHGERLALLGCYYALQFLHMNLRLTDVLQLDLTSGVRRTERYREFMLQSGLQYRTLTASYMQHLLDVFLPPDRRPEFVICAVGSRSDQDDIDIGVVDDGSPNREELNKAIGHLRKEMLKHASCLHFHLSENVGTEGYSASISDYRSLLDSEIHDFVILTEMLGAAPIFGSSKLFAQFKREITWRYHYAPHQDNRYHEGYLRGILGEVRSLLIRRMRSDSIHLKDDGLRMLKSMIYVEKTIFRIDEVNPWRILDALRSKNPDRRTTYDSMVTALTFLEIFRHMYQLFVVQEEEIFLPEDYLRDDMAIVARSLGYQDLGAVKAWDHLLIHYYESVELAKAVVRELLEDATGHLRSISLFSSIAKGKSAGRADASIEANLSVRFLRTSRFFRGARFWDDVLASLDADDEVLLRHFTDDFNRLNKRIRARLVNQYGGACRYSFYATISLLVILANRCRTGRCSTLFDELNQAFLRTAPTVPRRLSKISRILHQYPRLLNTYLMNLSEDELIQFEKILEEDVQASFAKQARAELTELCRLYYGQSQYFRRCLVTVVKKYPEFVLHLDSPDTLVRIGQGLLGSVNNLNLAADRKRVLGEYYDLEFLRVGLGTLRGVPISKTNTEFTDFSDSYLRMLFDVCKQSVDTEIGTRVATRDLLAVFAAGGHGREQAYDDDYDMIILLDSSSAEMRDYCDLIAARMNTEILKRGTLPHYRFADHFGHYVTLVEELDALLETRRADTFIDQCQILGSRMIIGSSKFRKEFEDRIVRRHIYDRKQEYVERMVEEIRSRHQDNRTREDTTLNVKDGNGGLRDIEMMLLIHKAKHHLSEPVNRRLIEALFALDPAHKKDFEILSWNFDFLKSARDVYRLTVSAEDTLRPEYLDRTARILGYAQSESVPPADQLLAVLRSSTNRVADIIERMMDEALVGLTA